MSDDKEKGRKYSSASLISLRRLKTNRYSKVYKDPRDTIIKGHLLTAPTLVKNDTNIIDKNDINKPAVAISKLKHLLLLKSSDDIKRNKSEKSLINYKTNNQNDIIKIQVSTFTLLNSI
jgi:hypothetical protein